MFKIIHHREVWVIYICLRKNINQLDVTRLSMDDNNGWVSIAYSFALMGQSILLNGVKQFLRIIDFKTNVLIVPFCHKKWFFVKWFCTSNGMLCMPSCHVVSHIEVMLINVDRLTCSLCSFYDIWTIAYVVMVL